MSGDYMNTFFTIAPGPQEGKVLSEIQIDKIRIHDVERAIIFSTNEKDVSSKLSDEILSLNLECEVIKLSSLTTQGMEDSTQLRSTPWKIANEMVSAYRDVGNAITMHGRGTRLHSHLLWVVANSFGSKSVSWDGDYHSDYIHNDDQLNSLVAPKLMSAILELNAKKDLQLFDSTTIASEEGVTELAGVQAAANPCISSGLLSAVRNKYSTFYQLTSSGLPVALKYWTEQRLNLEEPKFKQLLISFSRLADQGTKNLVNIITKIEPHDSYLFILQRYMDSPKSGVFTIDQLLGDESFTEIHDELIRFNDVISRRKEEEEFEMLSPLVLINPSADQTFSLEFQSRMFIELRKNERANELFKWNFDITSCVGKIQPQVSEFATASRSNLYYVLKSRKGEGVTGTEVSSSPFSRADHVLQLPSYLALESLKGLADSKLMALVVLQYYEKGVFSKPEKAKSLSDFVNRDRKISINNGLTFKDLSGFVTPLAEIVGHDIKIEKNHTRLAGELISNKFIHRVNDVGKSRYVLTELGTFVANWVIKQLGWE
jgi:hypothetical protein